jgi:hypothetical protein
MDAKAFRVLTLTIVLALFAKSLITAWRYTYYESSNRFAMTHSIEHPLLVGVYTTKERAKVVSELLDAMAHVVKPGEELLAYNSIPTIHFLTETRPWLGNAWPDIFTTEVLTAKIQQKELEGTKLPYIVRARFATWSHTWPQVVEPLFMAWGIADTREILTKFVQRHRYVVVWSNDFFEILTTDQSLTH